MNFEISSRDLVLQRRSPSVFDDSQSAVNSTFTLQDHVDVIQYCGEEFHEMVSTFDFMYAMR